jgi:hypothetical protein
MKELNVLMLGAGVQSTTLYLMDAAGLLPVRFDAAIMGDTGDEPQEVYRHLEWLKTVGGAPIHVVSKGTLSVDLVAGRGPSRRFASIPAFTKRRDPKRGEKKEGRVRRQCTAEYKIEPAEKAIREILVGLKPRQRFPVMHYRVVQHFGISGDETRRAGNIMARFGVAPGTAVEIGPFWVGVPQPKGGKAKAVKPRGSAAWSRPRFPLLELGMGRRQCQEWLKDRVPHTVPRSACVYCPFKSDWEWLRLKGTGGPDWDKAVELDRQLRVPGNAVSRGMQDEVYLHRSLIPLELIDFTNAAPPTIDPMSVGECEGMCGV